MKQVNVKSEKLYEVKSLYGVPHTIKLVAREYNSGKTIYILKTIFQYPNHPYSVFKSSFDNCDNALKALKEEIIKVTFCNIEFQISLPF